jgi:transcription termination/antitermination protein NusG
MSENIGDLNDNWNINQEIEIIDGPFNGFKGVIYFINREKMILRVKVNLWGRDTPVELDFSQIKPLD